MTIKTVQVPRSQVIMGTALFAALAVAGWQFYNGDQQKGKTELQSSLTEQEIRLLQQELATERAKPTYDEGFRDALLRRGGPNQPGSYKDGYEAAIKLMGNKGYADGYHNAIEQFGYQTEGKEITPKIEDKKPEPKK
jgi:hypothetical protein